MSKKFSIVKTLDIDKLDSEIEEYICINKEINPYIFMSNETAEAIIKELDPMGLFDTRIKNKKGHIALYTGYRVFIDDAKKYGDIEIRWWNKDFTRFFCYGKWNYQKGKVY